MKVLKLKLKLKLIIAVALAVVFATSIAAFIGVSYARADRNVTISGSSIFYTSGEAQVWAHQVAAQSEDGEDEYYTMFTFKGDNDTVTYRRNLAYNWFYNLNDVVDGDETEENTVAEGAEGHLTMVVGFEELNFERFVIAFETQQYNATKDKKTTNYVIFVPADSQTVNVLITDDKDMEVPEGSTSIGMDNITIALSGKGAEGFYGVTVSDSEGSEVTGEFVNVGEMYAKYSSSSTNPVTPLTFTANLPESSDGRVRMALYSLNGQSFLLASTSARPIDAVNNNDGEVDHYTGGQVNDTTPPVLCLDKGVSFIEEGAEISFNFTVIDVLTQSPSSEMGYYILTKEQASDVNFEAENYGEEGLFRVVTDADNQYMIPHANHYVPEILEGSPFSEDVFEPVAAVKIYLKLTDTASNGGQSTYVMLDWFVEDEYLLEVNGNKYIAIAHDTEGATYNYGDNWDELVAKYQQAVTEAAADLQAGSQNNFYLPSLENLISDNATAYKDMIFSIYYNNGSQQSNTNNSASALSISLSKAGIYQFAVYAQDASGNKMWYEKDGEKVELATSDFWTMYADEDDEGLDRYLPWFSFEVGSAEISVEDPGEQDMAYVGTQYSGISFDINGVSYNASYSLYLFNSETYYEVNGEALTYDKFMEDKQDLFENHREWFTEIKPASTLDSSDEDYDYYNSYAWNNTSRTFIPQDENAFYLVKCEVTSSEDARSPITAYMGIASSARPKAIKGENTWLRDNMVSIILLSIAGASLIGIILLVVIKPKNNGDIDVQFEEEKKSKTASK